MLIFFQLSFWKRVFKKASSYRETVIYLWKTKGPRAAYNFVFTKLFVKHGEGSWGLGFIFINPLLKLFPRLTSLFAFYPFNIEIEGTTRCNKRCIICEHTYWNEASEDLVFEDFKKIVDQFSHLKWVNLTGEGDAFLNRDYLNTIEYLKAKDVCVYLVDSFDLINENIAKRLIELGVDGIYVSFDAATKETYEKIKVGCSFEKVVNNIKNLIRIKKDKNSPIPELCFRYVFTTLNIHEIPQYIELIHSFDDNCKIEFVGLLKFDEVEPLYLPNIPEDILNKALKKTNSLPIEIYFSHTDENSKPPLEYCNAWFEPYIMMGGYVLPCCAVLQNNNRSLLRRYSFGNILKTPFKDIWYSARYRSFRKMVPTKRAKVPILCRGCRIYDTSYREEHYGVVEDI